ncbi:MAG: tRNA dihydrouridine synthase DusB [Eubacterium sp.]|nr:tRNA dihydrouridine synthase DusB [Eubacterium sp.]
MKEIKIGGVKVDTPLALGPMAGVTDLPFRKLCKEQGAGLVCTEMVSAKAILYHNKNTAELMKIDPEEHPVQLQLFGSEPETVAEAARMIEEEPFDIFDFNMGCPVPKVVNNHEGSYLMTDLKLAHDIISALVRAVRKPVTVKIRKGFDLQHVNAAEAAKVLEDAGASAITVHGRTRSQYYSGQADWDIIREVKEAVSIPVFGNGDVTSGASAKAMLDMTGCDGIMIARAARGNPWIFSEIRGYLERGEEIAKPAAEDIYQMILRHLNMLTEYKGEYTALREMRKHIGWYTAGVRNSSSLRRKVNLTTGREELEALLKEWRGQAG